MRRPDNENFQNWHVLSWKIRHAANYETCCWFFILVSVRYRRPLFKATVVVMLLMDIGICVNPLEMILRHVLHLKLSLYLYLYLSLSIHKYTNITYSHNGSNAQTGTCWPIIWASISHFVQVYSLKNHINILLKCQILLVSVLSLNSI